MFNELFNTIALNEKFSLLTIIIPVLFFALLFIGSKPCQKKEYNEGYLNKQQTDIIKGFCAIGIILHHLAQKTAAPWLSSQYIIHGLDFFVNIGYLFVGTFLFISGYGLYKSYKSNEHYFDNYFSRRILPIIIAYLITSLVYYLYYPKSSTYTWYVFAILVCYTFFYFGFKYIKKEFISFSIVIVGIVIYSTICSFLILGGWWYNTIGLFVIGLVYAKFEKNIFSFIKKAYIPLLIISLIITIIGNYYGRYYEIVIHNVKSESIYDLYSFLIILFRFVAAIGFSLAIILVSLKYKLKNKVLAFLSSISLEFYLIQGLFVQMFSYCYFDANVEPLYYIKNVFLYMFVVIALSTASAYLLNYIDRKIREFILFLKEKRKYEIDFITRSLKKLFIVMGIILVSYFLFLSIKSFKENVGAKEAITEYKEKYIKYADIDGRKMAAYIVGEGQDTLVFMRGNNDPCPSLSMRYLADRLSQGYKVIVLDYFGTGFSDEPKTARISKNIVKEIHEALIEFGVDGKYILVPQYISGIYAQEYVKEYQDEVKGIITIETEILPEREAILKYTGLSSVEYHKHQQVDNYFKYILGRLVNIKGVDTLVWTVEKKFYKHGLSEDELIVARNLFFDNIYDSIFLDENKNELENIYQSLSAQYPRETYVYDIIGNQDSMELSLMGYSLETLHAETCFDRAKHKTKIVNDIYETVFYDPGIAKVIIDEAIETMK
ncbi:MAG: acyltransferase [Erysipelotrichaceae bacterium]|nr:acyltransferase [Erysipelotrichaceae bacterium]